MVLPTLTGTAKILYKSKKKKKDEELQANVNSLERGVERQAQTGAEKTLTNEQIKAQEAEAAYQAEKLAKISEVTGIGKNAGLDTKTGKIVPVAEINKNKETSLKPSQEYANQAFNEKKLLEEQMAILEEKRARLKLALQVGTIQGIPSQFAEDTARAGQGQAATTAGLALAGATAGAGAGALLGAGVGAVPAAIAGGAAGLLGSLVTKITIGEKQNVKEAMAIATASQTNINNLIAGVNAGIVSPEYAIQELANQKQNLLLSQRLLKKKTQSSVGRALSAAQEEQAKVDAYLEDVYPYMEAKLKEAIISPNPNALLNSAVPTEIISNE